MKKTQERDKEKRQRKKRRNILFLILLLTGMTGGGTLWYSAKEEDTRQFSQKPEEVLREYMDCITEKNYEKMYRMLAADSAEGIGRDAFIKRNAAIYEGMEVQNMKITVTGYDEERQVVKYRSSFDTVGGTVEFEQNAVFQKEEGQYKLLWNDSLIVPGLGREDKVRVSTVAAKRGRILDRNGAVLAGAGTASLVGLVPGKLKDREPAVKKVAEILGMKPEDIEKKLAEKWVKEDSFVPLQTCSKGKKKKLLNIPGVMISNTEVREYPLGEAAVHLIGYIQGVTAEDLEKHAGEGYTESSQIGRTGLEGLLEKDLKGKNGCRITITDSEGEEKEEITAIAVQNGQDIRLTIDTVLQKELYETFQEDKSCQVAMNPKTGEVLALVSTPSFDANEFILGISEKRWKTWNEDEKKPLYNRIRQTWCPGSSLKPVIAAVGLEAGAIRPDKDYGSEGLRWQKDKSWGTYYVTTLHTYQPVTLKNALIYSDNIYFAKVALRMGADKLEDSLSKLGFQSVLPFEITMGESRFSNTGHIEGEVQLADSGYGQGQMLVNPLHMACLYSAFSNEGNVIKPYLIYKEEVEPEFWIPGVCSEETARLVLEGMTEVVNNPAGTGYAAHREDVLLAGKTGTAEIKASKEDTSGTELGWFVVFNREKGISQKDASQPLLVVSMVEDVRNRGGSGYVVRKEKQVLEKWFAGV